MTSMPVKVEFISSSSGSSGSKNLPFHSSVFAVPTGSTTPVPMHVPVPFPQCGGGGGVGVGGSFCMPLPWNASALSQYMRYVPMGSLTFSLPRELFHPHAGMGMMGMMTGMEMGMEMGEICAGSASTLIPLGEAAVEVGVDEAQECQKTHSTTMMEQPRKPPQPESYKVPQPPEEWYTVGSVLKAEELRDAVVSVDHGKRNVWEGRWQRWSERIVFPYKADRREYDDVPEQPVVIIFHPHFVDLYGRKLKLSDGMLQLGFIPTKDTLVYIRDELEASKLYNRLVENRRASRARKRARSLVDGEDCS